jgi:hypothetical protein
MCININNTNFTTSHCNNNITNKSIIIFIISGLIFLISIIFIIMMYASKPIWLEFELKINQKYNNNDKILLLNDNNDDELLISVNN